MLTYALVEASLAVRPIVTCFIEVGIMILDYRACYTDYSRQSLYRFIVPQEPQQGTRWFNNFARHDLFDWQLDLFQIDRGQPHS